VGAAARPPVIRALVVRGVVAAPRGRGLALVLDGSVPFAGGRWGGAAAGGFGVGGGEDGEGGGDDGGDGYGGGGEGEGGFGAVEGEVGGGVERRGLEGSGGC